MLTSEKRFTIESNVYEKLASEYSKAIKNNDLAKVVQIRNEALAKCFRNKINPGESKNLSIFHLGDPQEKKVVSSVKWYPKTDFLQVDAVVTDPYFATDSPEMPWMASAFEVFVCPSGLSEDINQYIVTPKGENGKASVWSLIAGKASQIDAAWERTAEGYKVDVKIPWSSLKGYQKGWKIMPIEAQIDSKAPGGLLQLLMNRSGTPVTSAKTYAALMSK